MRRSRSRGAAVNPATMGFTLVELLVVITIIGILVGLLMTAVNAARETARRAICMNNLKQLGIGATQHEQVQGWFPTGGWGWNWIGDPDRGFGHRQPGGWIYNILPYIEQQPLHDLGKGLAYSSSASGTPGINNKADAAIQLVQTPLSLLNCPSRRRAILYPKTFIPNSPGDSGETGGVQFGKVPPMVAKPDYAANAGGFVAQGEGGGAQYFGGPNTLSAGDDPTFGWHSRANQDTPPDGICYERSEIKAAMITDGLSNTIFCGEKYLDPDHYFNGADMADNEGSYVGMDNDVNRDTFTPPMQDTPGYENDYIFGSAHVGACQFVMCDGSTRALSYMIDVQTYQLLGARNDATAIDPSKLGP